MLGKSLYYRVTTWNWALAVVMIVFPLAVFSFSVHVSRRKAFPHSKPGGRLFSFFSGPFMNVSQMARKITYLWFTPFNGAKILFSGLTRVATVVFTFNCLFRYLLLFVDAVVGIILVFPTSASYLLITRFIQTFEGRLSKIINVEVFFNGLIFSHPEFVYPFIFPVFQFFPTLQLTHFSKRQLS